MPILIKKAFEILNIREKITAYIWLFEDYLKIHAPKVIDKLLYPFVHNFSNLNPLFFIVISMKINRIIENSSWDSIVRELLIKTKYDSIYKCKISEMRTPEIDLSIRRTIELKKPIYNNGRITEKGVILITFTTSFDFFHKYIDIEKILCDYFIILEPSWSGYCEKSILKWTKYSKSKIIIMATERKDQTFIQSLNSNLLPVDFGASDWVDTNKFYPIQNIQKIYDSIYVCSFRKIKRHHLFFKSIAQIKDSSYQAAMACGKWGNSKELVFDLIKYYGIKKNITIFEALSQKDLNILLNQSKVNVLFSKKEGSNRSIFEGFFANVPGIVLKSNIGLNKNYINQDTGILVDENKVTDALVYFRNNWRKYNPRIWAQENISPVKTTEKLNKCLVKLSHDEGTNWTVKIVPKTNNPEVSYFHIEDRERFAPISQILNKYRNNSWA